MYPSLSHLIEGVTGYWVPLPFQTFGFFVAIAIVVAAYLLELELKRKYTEHLIHASYNKKGEIVSPHKRTATILFLAVVFGIIGARVFSILEYPSEFLEAPLYVLLSTSGFTFYGGLIFGAGAVLIYAKKVNIPAVHLVDAAAPALMVAYAIGRLGCHLSGDGDWGIVNDIAKPEWLAYLPDWLWSYRYPHNVVEAGIPLTPESAEFNTILPVAVYPTPVYETIICTILFFILWLVRKKVATPGLLFSLYLVISGFERLLIEQIRVDAEYNLFDVFVKQSEIISLLLIVSGIIAMYFLRKRNSLSTYNLLYPRK